MLICGEKKLIGATFDTRLCRPYCCQAGLVIYIVISSLSHFFLCKAGCSIFIGLEDKRSTVNPPPRQRLKQNPSKIYSYIYFSDPKRTTWPGRRLMRATWFCFKTIQKLLDKIPFYRYLHISHHQPSSSSSFNSVLSSIIQRRSFDTVF